MTGGEVIINRDSIESAQTRRSGGVIIRTKQGGTFIVDAKIEEIEQWMKGAA